MACLDAHLYEIEYNHLRCPCSHQFAEHFEKSFKLAKVSAKLSCHACQFKLENLLRRGSVYSGKL
jgi:hypothetical protein